MQLSLVVSYISSSRICHTYNNNMTRGRRVGCIFFGGKKMNKGKRILTFVFILCVAGILLFLYFKPDVIKETKCNFEKELVRIEEKTICQNELKELEQVFMEKTRAKNLVEAKSERDLFKKQRDDYKEKYNDYRKKYIDCLREKKNCNCLD